MRFRGLVRAVAPIALIIPVGSGCGGGSERSASSPDQWVLAPPASVAVELARAPRNEDPGPTLFEHYCAICHGPEGKGDGIYFTDSLSPKPADLTNPPTVDDWSQEHIAKVVREGSAGAAKSPLCPPWGRVFSDAQVAAVAAHVHGLRPDPP